MVGALREAVGPDVDIMVDFHGRPASVNAAMDYIEAIEPARHHVRRRAAAARGRGRAGAHHSTLAGARSLPASGWSAGASSRSRSRARAFHIAQPDICHTGGLFEAKKIAALAETAGIGLAPHNPLGPIAGVAALHFGIRTPNFIIQEEMSGAVPWYDEVVTWPIERKPGRWDAARTARPRRQGQRGRHRQASRSSRRCCTPAMPSWPTARWSTGDPWRAGSQGKIAIVTGAGQGIGEATARALAAQGAAIVIAELNAATGAGHRRRVADDPARRRCSSRRT